ncbi:MAG TPA: hypothetical protein VFA75_19135 [Nevskia sp.]|nr:hypothetical protein [Nevskia sp.]
MKPPNHPSGWFGGKNGKNPKKGFSGVSAVFCALHHCAGWTCIARFDICRHAALLSVRRKPAHPGASIARAAPQRRRDARARLARRHAAAHPQRSRRSLRFAAVDPARLAARCRA